MPSAVRVRRHANSRFLRFLDATSTVRDAETSVSSYPHLEGDQAKSSETLSKKPQLGYPNAEQQRPAFSRRQSAVERLIADDKKHTSGSSTLESKQGSRATAGHAPQLSSVSEDHPTSNTRSGTEGSGVLYKDTIGEEGESAGPSLQTGESNADEYFDAAQSDGGDTSSTGHLQPQSGGKSEPHTVPRFLTPLADRSRGTQIGRAHV